MNENSTPNKKFQIQFKNELWFYERYLYIPNREFRVQIPELR